VRLIGVDTPETVDPRKPVQFFGKEASAFTKKLLTGESVILEYDQQKTDKYGRVLAYVYRAKDKLFVNLEIIKQGYGHAYTKYPFAQEKMDAFRAAEKAAREGKKGLWGDAPVQAKEQAATGKETMYVTSSGKKYHAEGCRHLAKSMAAISVADAKKRGLEPCKVCNPLK
jgi:micrococcal nuclease